MFVAQNSSIKHDITSIARCKSQQKVQNTEIKIKVLENKCVLKTVKSYNGELYISQTTHNKL